MVLLKSSLIGKPVILGYIPKNLVTTVRAHEELGHRGPGSIRNPVISGYIPKNLVNGPGS